MKALGRCPQVKKNIKTILLIYAFLFLGLVLAASCAEVLFFGEPLTLLFQEHFFPFVLTGGALAVIRNFFLPGFVCFRAGSISAIVLFVVAASIPASIFFSIKKGKLFPFIVIFILCSCVYIFIGMIIFGIRYGE